MNTAGDLDLYFDRVGQNANGFSETAGVGLGGTRGITATTSATGENANLEKASFAGNLPSFTISAYLKWKDRTNFVGFPFRLGFSAASSAYNEDTIAFGLTNVADGPQLQIVNTVGTGASVVSKNNPLTLTDGAWYFVEGEVTSNAGVYDVELRLYAADSDGNRGTLVDSFVRTNMTNTTLYNDSARAYFNAASSAVQRGFDAMDNFTSPVPEPSSALLLLLSAGLLAAVRRRC